jgi:hypothetical protein
MGECVYLGLILGEEARELEGSCEVMDMLDRRQNV